MDYDEEIVVKLIESDGTEQYLVIWVSQNDCNSEECDECLGFTLYDSNKVEVDGGALDYNSKEKNYASIEDAVADVVEFIYDILPEVIPTDLTSDDFS